MPDFSAMLPNKNERIWKGKKDDDKRLVAHALNAIHVMLKVKVNP